MSSQVPRLENCTRARIHAAVNNSTLSRPIYGDAVWGLFETSGKRDDAAGCPRHSPRQGAGASHASSQAEAKNGRSPKASAPLAAAYRHSGNDDDEVL